MITFILSSFMVIFISYKLFAIQIDPDIHFTHNPIVRTIEAPRGTIFSEDGRILSLNMSVYDIRLDLYTIDDKFFDNDILNLSKKLSSFFQDKSAFAYEKELRDNKNERYFLFKRNISYTALQELKQFPIFKEGRNKGGFIPEIKSNRDYPFGSLCKVTLGKVNIVRLDNGKDSLVPKNGIELAFNEYLQGIPGKEMSQEIAHNVLMPKRSEQNKLPKPGMDIITTINIEFQDAAELALKKKLEETNAVWGSVVLMEVKTGKVKAIANLHRGEDSTYFDSKNHAIITPIAPGSTFKLASLIAVLEDRYLDITDSVETGNGEYTFFKETKDNKGYSIRDTKKGGYGKLTLGDIFVKSSNIGISKVIFENYKKQPEKFISHLNRFHLTKSLDLQLSYADRMLIKTPERKDWWGSTLPAMSIGYEMSLSPLHILTFYNAFANNGKMVSPQFVTDIKGEQGIVKSFPTSIISQKICSQSTIDKILPYMIEVVNSGTAKNIRTDKYSIAGKTGTCKVRFWEWNRLTKYQRSYSSSFVGFFPAEKPKYSCIVVIHDFIDPTDNYHYGGIVAAPVFKEISDKVFAFDSEIAYHSNSEEDSEGENTPIDLRSIQKAINSSIENEEIVRNNLKKNIVPNLHGMEIMSALFLLENARLDVEFDGIGKVISQSLRVGDKFEENDEIILKLSL